MTDPAESYRRDRLSPKIRFDEVEATVSHLLRRPHPALGGRSFGGALYAALRDRGLIRSEVFEIGGGAAFVAREMIAAATKDARPLRWTFLDLSPALLDVQRAQVADARHVRAHAERLPLRTGSVTGLVLANEVIADLRTENSDHPEAIELTHRYTLSPAKRVNVGAVRCLEELARVLGAGGTACLTEFGGDFDAEPVRLEGGHGEGRHVEHSIHFGHLERVATKLDLSSERVLLCDLLSVDRTVRVASYPDALRLRRVLPRLPVLAHPKEQLEREHPFVTRLFRFELPEIGSPRFPDPRARAGFCQLFHALLLRAPGS